MMSAANLDEVKKKYNFKEISVATWRDPVLSIHPARGGPDSPGVLPNSPYFPTYKINYDSLPQATDDEESLDEEEDEASLAESPINPALEETFEGSIVDDQHSEDFPAEVPSPKEHLDDLDRETTEDLANIGEQELDSTRTDLNSVMANEEGHETTTESVPLEADVPTHEVGDQANNNATSDIVTIELAEGGAAAGTTTPSEAGSDERRVSFAPGTPDPKPTPRKKKSANGTKGKKKRIAVPLDGLPAEVMAMIDGAFDGLPPPPPPAPDAPLDDDIVLDDVSKDSSLPVEASGNDPLPPEEDSTIELASSTTSDPKTLETDSKDEIVDEAAPEPVLVQEGSIDGEDKAQLLESITEAAVLEEPPVDVSELEPVVDSPSATEKSSKKKSSKGSKDKDKDKSKKKSSKSKSRGLSPPPTGLGIEMPPPPNLDLDGSANEDTAPPAIEDQNLVPVPLEQENLAASGSNDPQLEVAEAEMPAPMDGGGNEKTPDDEVTTDASAANEDGRKPEAETTPESANEEAVVDAWDQSPELGESPDQPTVSKANNDEHDNVPLESAPSPADSGVEFAGATDNDNGVTAEEHGEEQVVATELKDAETIEEPKEASEDKNAGDEVVATNPSPDNEAVTDHSLVDGPSPEHDSGDPETAITADQDAEPAAEDTKEEESAREPPSGEDALVAADVPEVVPVTDGIENLAPDNEEPAKPVDDAALPADGTDADNTVEGGNDATGEATVPAEDAAGYEPPTVESVSEEPKIDPFEFEVVAPPSADSKAPEDINEEGKMREAEVSEEPPKEENVIPDAPPSPNLSKSDSQGSQNHKVDHWERKHADSPLKDVFEDTKVLERPHVRGKDGSGGLRVRDRHRKSRRLSSSGEDEGERRRRRATRRTEEAARLADEQRKRAEDEERHQARRAARKAAAEEAAKAESQTSPKNDNEARRHRHRERDAEKADVRGNRQLKAALPSFTLPAIPKALGLTVGESVHGTTVVRSYGGAYRPAKEATKAPAPTPKEEAPAKEAPKDIKPKSPPGSADEKPHRKHRHHHRHRSDGERSSHKGGERRSRRPSFEERIEERPRSFLGGLIRI